MLRFLTAGESHGSALTGIIDGIPAGLEIGAGYIDRHLARRQMGHGRGKRMEIEEDRVEIVSGIRFGKTIGSPVALRIENRDWVNWKDKMAVDDHNNDHDRVTLPRPGHADFTGGIKYGHTTDLRNVLERSSARETAMRVAIGSLARRLLEEFGATIGSVVESIGDIDAGELFGTDGKEVPDIFAVDNSPVRCPVAASEEAMIELIDRAGADGDTLGGCFAIWAEGVPAGLGSHVQWDRRIDSQLAGAVMSIPAIKGVEIGRAFEMTRSRGSVSHDEFRIQATGGEPGIIRRPTNRAGGIEGGITNGETVIIHAAMKPLPTLRRPIGSVDLVTGREKSAHVERSDVCAVPAAAVVAESVVALVLCNAMLEKFGGDTTGEIEAALKRYTESRPPHLREPEA